jgi:hypothetical protein
MEAALNHAESDEWLASRGAFVIARDLLTMTQPLLEAITMLQEMTDAATWTA